VNVALVKYNAGNVLSVTHALRRLGIEPVVTDDPRLLLEADKVILPGVGEASSAMRYLRMKGMDKVLKKLKQPFLGICLGLQLMCNHSEENDTSCLGIFDLSVRKFPPQNKVPHMGWNRLIFNEDPLFRGLDENAFIYYVHSYYAEISNDTIGTSEYILPFSAVLRKGNFYAIQGHPEKSGTDGEKILKNFIEL